MPDPITRVQSAPRRWRRRVAAHRNPKQRRGAIIPLFAILLPLLLIFAGFAINLAYMQLTATELKITTDCAAHAGGRAMSVAQGDQTLTNEQKRQKAIADGIAKAQEIAQANPVVGRTLSVGTSGDDSEIQVIFGKSIRGNNGYGRYEFTEMTLDEINSQNKRPSSLSVVSNMNLPMVFNVMKDIEKDGRHISSFSPRRRSVATQIDRDIALVLDRSGSMLYYRDDQALSNRLRELYDNPEQITVPGGWMYHYWRRYNGYWYDRGYSREEDAHSSWERRNTWDKYWQDSYTYTERRITWGEYADATDWLYDRYYSANVIYQLEKWENPSHTLGNSYSSWENYKLTSEMAQYCHDWKYTSSAARYSRWWYLEQGVDAFLDVLDITDQEELVSLVTFNSSATLDYSLQDSYGDIRNYIDGIDPYGGTAIGDGMTTGLPPIVSGTAARPFAAKTIVVLTDGVSNAGQDPDDAVEYIMGQHLVTIHTVTFTPGADKTAMASVAAAGQGRHYHADDGSALIEIFEEIANNLPTILTE
ncbi:MAG: VWA domain-containing protein [Planctomycetota bacterium]